MMQCKDVGLKVCYSLRKKTSGFKKTLVALCFEKAFGILCVCIRQHERINILDSRASSHRDAHVCFSYCLRKRLPLTL